MSKRLRVATGITFSVTPALSSGGRLGESFVSRVEQLCNTTLTELHGVKEVHVTPRDEKQLFIAVNIDPEKVKPASLISTVHKYLSIFADYGRDSDLLAELLDRHPELKDTGGEERVMDAFHRLVALVQNSGAEAVSMEQRRQFRDQSLAGKAAGQAPALSPKPTGPKSPVPPQYDVESRTQEQRGA
jgi:hypothetical protein